MINIITYAIAVLVIMYFYGMYQFHRGYQQDKQDTFNDVRETNFRLGFTNALNFVESLQGKPLIDRETILEAGILKNKFESGGAND